MPDHFIVLRHQEGDDWDYCVIQHLGPKATVDAAGTPPGAARTMRAWHTDTFASGPSWAEVSKALGIGTASTTANSVYVVQVWRELAGHRDELAKSLAGATAGSKVPVSHVMFQHVEGPSVDVRRRGPLQLVAGLRHRRGGVGGRSRLGRRARALDLSPRHAGGPHHPAIGVLRLGRWASAPAARSPQPAAHWCYKTASAALLVGAAHPRALISCVMGKTLLAEGLGRARRAHAAERPDAAVRRPAPRSRSDEPAGVRHAAPARLARGVSRAHVRHRRSHRADQHRSSGRSSTSWPRR